MQNSIPKAKKRKNKERGSKRLSYELSVDMVVSHHINLVSLCWLF